MPQSTQPLDQLIETLESLVNRADPPADAIDRILADAPRTTAVRALRDTPVVARFREDLTNGFIRIDAANALFRIITDVLTTRGA